MGVLPKVAYKEKYVLGAGFAVTVTLLFLVYIYAWKPCLQSKSQPPTVTGGAEGTDAALWNGQSEDAAKSPGAVNDEKVKRHCFNDRNVVPLYMQDVHSVESTQIVGNILDTLTSDLQIQDKQLPEGLPSGRSSSPSLHEEEGFCGSNAVSDVEYSPANKRVGILLKNTDTVHRLTSDFEGRLAVLEKAVGDTGTLASRWTAHMHTTERELANIKKQVMDISSEMSMLSVETTRPQSPVFSRELEVTYLPADNAEENITQLQLANLSSMISELKKEFESEDNLNLQLVGEEPLTQHEERLSEGQSSAEPCLPGVEGKGSFTDKTKARRKPGSYVLDRFKSSPDEPKKNVVGRKKPNIPAPQSPSQQRNLIKK